MAKPVLNSKTGKYEVVFMGITHEYANLKDAQAFSDSCNSMFA
ncbi:hypothetical protein [Neptuniibacter sp. QD37_11]